MDSLQAVITEIFDPLDLGLMDKIFDPYDRMNPNSREDVPILCELIPTWMVNWQ